MWRLSPELIQSGVISIDDTVKGKFCCATGIVKNAFVIQFVQSTYHFAAHAPQFKGG